jgi:hypothetical protein
MKAKMKKPVNFSGNFKSLATGDGCVLPPHLLSCNSGLKTVCDLDTGGSQVVKHKTN